MWGDILVRFWFAFRWSLVILNIFSCVCWPSVFLSSLEKCLFRSSAHFLIRLFVFWCGVVVSVFWTLTPYLLYQLQIFSPIQLGVSLFCRCFPLLCKSFWSTFFGSNYIILFLIKAYRTVYNSETWHSTTFSGSLFWKIHDAVLEKPCQWPFLFIRCVLQGPACMDLPWPKPAHLGEILFLLVY